MTLWSGPRAGLLLLLGLAAVALQAAAAAGADAASGSEAAPTMAHLDLTKATIEPKLSALPPDDSVLIEFFASWCPACRAFKPDYEKAAAFIEAHSSVHVFRLDCASDPDVCDKYKVAGYPTVYAGRAADVAAVQVKDLERFDLGHYRRTAEGVVQFTAKHFKLDLTYSEGEAPQAAAQQAQAAGPKPQPAPVAKGASSSSSSSNRTAAGAAAGTGPDRTLEWTASDVEAATRQLFASITFFHPASGLAQRRAALLLLLRSWAAGHPLPACAAGSAALLRALPDLWPPDAANDPWGTEATAAAAAAAAQNASPTASSEEGSSNDGKAGPPRDVCDPAAIAAAASAGRGQQAQQAAAAPAGGSGSSGSSGSYVACKGSLADSRGFTCGLWLLFHTLSVRLPEADGGALLVSALRGFAQYFFQCDVCRKHFIQVTSSPEAAVVRTRREGVLWLWRAHNEVNARLHKVETQYGHSSTGDPAFPKLQWPLPADCPKCRKQPAQQAGGSNGSNGGTKGAAQQQQQQRVEWDDAEVYRFLLKWYGRHPGATGGSTGSNDAARLAAVGGGGGGASYFDRIGRGSSSMGGGGGGGGGIAGLLTSPLGVLLLVAAGLGGWAARRAGLCGGRGGSGCGGISGSNGSRRHLPVKGPGVFGGRPWGAHPHHPHHHHAPLPRHGRSNGSRLK